MGLTTLVALISNGAVFGSALTAVYGGVGGALILGAVRLLAATALSALLGQRQPPQQDIRAQLQFPTSRPAMRFVYGVFRAPGTPLPSPVVGGVLYQAWLVNSRPSEGGFTVYFDNREVELTGDPYDFSEGGGATATNAPFAGHVRIWIGRGDQTAPPWEFTDEALYDGSDELLWKATDAGQGCTVVFARLVAGAPANRNERWVSSPPQLDLEGQFTKVFDPREVGHDAADSDTWEHSRNSFLVGLDVLLNNPLRPYSLSEIHSASLIAAADAADETVALNSGGSEARYCCDGIVVFDGAEIETMVEPIMATAAARLTRIGGQLGFVPGVARDVSGTITESLGGLQFSSMRPDRERITELRVNYSPKERGYEGAELAKWEIPGALAKDGGSPATRQVDLSMVSSDTQAQRIRQILGRQNRLQRSLEQVLPASALDYVPGSVVTADFPAPFDAMNGDYEVVTIQPLIDPVGEDGAALRCQVALAQYADVVFDWDETADEVAVTHPVYDGDRDGVTMPGVITATSGAGVDLDVGGAVLPRIRFEFDPATTSGVLHYDWQWRVNDAGNGADDNWQQGGSIDPEILDADGDVFGYLAAFDITDLHDIRVRTVATSGMSDWRVISGIVYDFALASVTLTTGPGRVEADFTSPDSAVFDGVRIYRATTGAAFSTAVQVGETLGLAIDTAHSVTAGDATTTNAIANGDFDDATGWTLGAGWTIAGGKASHASGTSSLIEHAVTLGDGATCRFAYTQSGHVSGGSIFQIDGDTNVAASVYSTDGTTYGVLTAPTNTVDAEIFGGAGFVGSVDNLFLFEETAECLTQGEFDFWIVPVALTGSEGTPVGPHTLIIP